MVRRGRRLRAGALAPWLFLLPSLALLFTFRILPVGQAVRLSFTDSRGYGDEQFVGFDNYVELVTDNAFQAAITNNGWILLSIPLWVFIPLSVAILINEEFPGWRIIRFVLFLPAVLSPVMIGVYFSIMLRFDGPINELLRAIGLEALVRQWLSDPTTALPVVIAIILWAGLGVGVLIFLGAMGTIDRDLYDAARIDGAGWVRLQTNVTLPQLRPTIVFQLIISVIGSFTVTFPFVFVLTRGGPGYATYVSELAVYQAAFAQGRFGYGAAMGLVVFLAILLVVLVALRLIDKQETR